METTKKKPIIYINPPPRDLSCEICGRKFSDIPYFNTIASMDTETFKGHTVRERETGKVKLLKTFRGHDQIYASWECADCIGTSTIDDVIEYFIEDACDEDGWPIVNQEAYSRFMENMTSLTKKAITKDSLYFENEEYSFCTNYWKKLFNL